MIFPLVQSAFGSASPRSFWRDAVDLGGKGQVENCCRQVVTKINKKKAEILPPKKKKNRCSFFKMKIYIV